MFMLPWVLVPDMCMLLYMASTRLLQSRSGGFSLFANRIYCSTLLLCHRMSRRRYLDSNHHQPWGTDLREVESILSLELVIYVLSSMWLELKSNEPEEPLCTKQWKPEGNVFESGSLAQYLYPVRHWERKFKQTESALRALDKKLAQS